MSEIQFIRYAKIETKEKSTKSESHWKNIRKKRLIGKQKMDKKLRISKTRETTES